MRRLGLRQRQPRAQRALRGGRRRGARRQRRPGALGGHRAGRHRGGEPYGVRAAHLDRAGAHAGDACSWWRSPVRSPACCCASDQCPGQGASAARMLVAFAPQIVLYGVGIVLTGVLQAHRRFIGPGAGAAGLERGGDRRVPALRRHHAPPDGCGGGRVAARPRWRAAAGARHDRRRRGAQPAAARAGAPGGGAAAPDAALRPGRRVARVAAGRSRSGRPARPAAARARHGAAVERLRWRGCVERLPVRAGGLPAAVRRARGAAGHRGLPHAVGSGRLG